MPIEHDNDETWLLEHLRPQAPQLFGSKETEVSQPSSAVGAAGLAQLSKPVVQVGLHNPPLHATAVALAPEQTRPQAPQLPVLVLVSVSQPSSAVGAYGCVQLPQPEAQVETQRPAEQVLDPTWLEEQLRPQAPQLSAFEARLVSQPLSAFGAAGEEQSP